MNPEAIIPVSQSPFRLECRLALRELLAAAVEYMDTGGQRQFSKEHHPRESTGLSVWLGRELAIKYTDVENRLRIELSPHKVSDQDVIDKLWELFCEVTGDYERYKPRGKLIQKVRDLEQEWDIAIEKFVCAFSIDYLDLGSSTFDICEVTFYTPDEEAVNRFGFDSDWWNSHAESVAKASVAQLEVSAGGPDQAHEVALNIAEEALVALKVAVLLGRQNRWPTDELLQWRLGGLWSVKPSGGNEGGRWGAHSTFRPLVMDLSEAIKAGVKSHGFDAFISTGLPEDIRKRLSLAVHWIARSSAYELDDYKIVDLCTALEIMLLPGHKSGHKGEPIALRYNLLGGDMNPSGVLGFYNLRSMIVHGSALGVSTQADTWRLRLLCFEVFALLVRRAKTLSPMSTLEELVAAVETPEGISTFVERCEMGIYTGTGVKAIRNFALLQFKRVVGTAPL